MHEVREANDLPDPKHVTHRATTKYVMRSAAHVQRERVRAHPPPPQANAYGRITTRLPVAAHLNPMHASMEPRRRVSLLLHARDAIVYPIVALRSAQLPCNSSVRWDQLVCDCICPRADCTCDVDGAGFRTGVPRQWRCVQQRLFTCGAAPLSCPRPTHLWANDFNVLPQESQARQELRLAERCDLHDLAAVAELCLPWLTDADSLLESERRSVRDMVFRLVAAYLLCVGAVASGCAVPAGHWNALALPLWSKKKKKNQSVKTKKTKNQSVSSCT